MRRAITTGLGSINIHEQLVNICTGHIIICEVKIGYRLLYYNKRNIRLF